MVHSGPRHDTSSGLDAGHINTAIIHGVLGVYCAPGNEGFDNRNGSRQRLDFHRFPLTPGSLLVRVQQARGGFGVHHGHGVRLGVHDGRGHAVLLLIS